MAIDYKIILTQVSGGNYVPVTTGSYALRIDPFSSNTHTGTHTANGVWDFDTVGDGVYQLWDTSGTPSQVTAFGEKYIGDKTPTFTSLTMGGNIVMGSNKITGLAAGTTNGDSVRYEDVIRTSGTQTGIAGNKSCTGVWLFDDLAFPKIDLDGAGEVPNPTNSQQFTPKNYVDNLYQQFVAPPQSPYVIQMIPSRTADGYSKTTMETCRTYLAGLTSITSRRGVIIVNPTEAANCAINVDDGTSLWCSNGIDIIGYNKPRLVRQSPNNSLTSDSRIRGVTIYDQVAAGRSYTNFVFDNCDFFYDGSGASLTFTSCDFQGINRIRVAAGTDINFTNCTGMCAWTNGTATISGTTPIDLRIELDANDLGTPA